MPQHALSPAVREQILRVANEPRFADMPPARIVPMLADEGRYIASESSFQRVLRAHGQNRHRGRSKAPRASRPPTTHVATAPRQLWCWDMTYLPHEVAGRWFYLYLILDVFSRKVVGFEVHDSDDADHAAHLLKRTALAEGIHASTAKYRPEFPAKGFADLDQARAWAARFVHWYNHEHRHSGIRYVSPAQRHAGEDRTILSARHALYTEARAFHPRRWSRGTRDWSSIDVVTLNPERETAVHAGAASATIKQPLAA